jgi:diaminohydroxyphosphoribosylaminopyrimidine deaminase/5-amino-6-(5-phosphoribosylamino)uracil reductase
LARPRPPEGVALPEGATPRDARLMALALREAARGRPSPNPHVGAVVARGDEVVAVGHHERAGTPHAEVNALRAAGERARGATLYVTFEPCNHHGRTGPCTDAILAAGVGRVVIAARDPAPHVPGAAEKLRAAGVEVVIGVRAREGEALVADFVKQITTGVPFVHLKAAVTLDGRIATRTGDSRWITGARARREAHRLRDRADAVLVGIGTVLADDPALTVRHVRGRDPLRVVLDAALRIPVGARVLTASARAGCVVVHAPDAPAERREELARLPGVTLLEVPRAPGPGGPLDLRAALAALGRRDVVRVLCEGGARVHGSLLAEDLVDRVSVFVAPVLLGDAQARPLAEGREVGALADALRLRDVRVRRLGDDTLIEGDVPHPTPFGGPPRRPVRA